MPILRALPIALALCAALALASHAATPQPVKTVAHDAPSVGLEMKYNIVLPAGYDDSDSPYPVLYLLHGLTSNYALWARMNVPEFAAQYDLIVVMPDAGNSWYVNWADPTDGRKHQWEDYIIKDLVSHIDATYRTIPTREGRAICGLSMGGYGAITLGLRHPDMFCSIGSHSGALAYARNARIRMESNESARGSGREPSTTPARIIGIEGFSSQAERYPQGKAFTTVDQCDSYDPFKLVRQVPHEQLPDIYVDCGTEDGLIDVARDFRDLLNENGIPLTYREAPGAHVPAYWSREVEHSMATQFATIQKSLHRSREPQLTN